MFRPWLVHPEPIRRLRDFTRYPRCLVRDRTREKQRVEKLLEDAQIKLSSVISDLFGVSGRAVLDALAAGQRDPKVLADLARVVRYLAETGVEQFCDLGSGLPAAGNVHEVAQSVRPGARVVYVDHDPVVLTHARALLATGPRTIVVEGDLRDPAQILADPAVRAHLDLSRPVAILLAAVLHFVVDDDQAAAVTAALRNRLVPGSYLALSHVADLAADVASPRSVRRAVATRAAAERYADLAAPFTLRTPDQIRALFAGFDLLPPGLVPAHRWRATGKDRGRAAPILAGLARLPPATDQKPEADPAADPTMGTGPRSEHRAGTTGTGQGT